MEKTLLYMTAGNMEEAQSIGQALVESKLIACANIIDHMHSIYVWDGKLQNDSEVILIAKTLKSRVPEIVETVCAMHSYDCPCIISIPISEGNPAFLDWIAAEVARPGPSA